jgi:hypothetical protein
MSSEVWEIWKRNVIGGDSTTRRATKRLDTSLLNKLPELEKLPERSDVIRICAKMKAYPPGWRTILKLPDRYMPEAGGVGEKPDYKRAAPYINSWQVKKDTFKEEAPSDS